MNVSRSQGESNPGGELRAKGEIAHGLAREIAGRLPPMQPARTFVGAFIRICRFDAALATATPVAATAAAAWWISGTIHPFALVFSLAAAFFGGLGIHLLSEAQDRALALAPQLQSALAATPDAPVRAPELARGEIQSLGLISLLISFVCSLWLGLLVGWPMILFGAASLLLGFLYSTPPVRYAEWGFGLGESGLFVAVGLLPAIGSYYAQSGTLDALALWSGVPFAMLVSLILLTQSLLHHRRDWLIRKRTLAVSLGLGRAIDLSTVLLIGAFVFILFAAIVSHLPLRTLIAMLALPIATGAYAQLDREVLPPVQGLRLYTAAIQATLATSLLYILAMLTDRLW